MTDASLCREVDECMSDVLEGVAPDALFDHIAACERCRDARHDAEQSARQVCDAAADYRLPTDLEARLLASLPEEPGAASAAGSNGASRSAEAAGVEATGATQAGPGESADHTPAAGGRPLALAQREPRDAPLQRGAASAARAGRKPWLPLLVAAACLALVWVSRRAQEPLGSFAESGEGWRGQVLQLQRAFGSPTGLSRCPSEGACQPLAEGEAIPAGAALETDGLTRARLQLADGSTLTLDRATRLELQPSAERRARLVRGNLVAEIQERPAEQGDRAKAIIETGVGRAEVLGTKFSLLVEPGRTRAEVSRGVVQLYDGERRSVSVRAGEAGQISSAAAPLLESAQDLGRSLAWSSEAFERTQAEDNPGALGSLTAKRPRDHAELNGAVQLTQHSVQVQIVDNIARTEVEEVFTNQTDEVLEGIYRFPLPAGAQIERLALDVDGKLVDGAYVDRERAAAIWRGAIVNAGGKKPVQEEIIWVPGPWKDPALLEWQRGNRFELRIYPIPRRSARRVVLAYTERLAPVAGRRQYVYPLPQDPGGSTRIARFTLDVQVRGHDVQQGVQAHGYALKELSSSPGVTRLAYEAEGFAPAGDLVLDYQLENAGSALRAWAYQPPGDSAYVALLLRPELPRRAEYQARDYVIAVDTSRSMIGENYRRAVAVVERTLRELDRHDRVTLLGCDSECQSWPGGFQSPGDASAEAAARFLRGIQPEGASDLALAVERAAALRERDASRALRLVYVGDGTPTVGPIHPALLRRAVLDALPRGATLSAVAIGSDADRQSLQALTEAAGGVTVAFAPGQSVADVAYSLLGATYGYTLQHARLSLPEGLEAVAPAQLGSIAAGAEELVVARLRGGEISGQAVLRGELAGEPYEQSYALRVLPSTSEANAFVPRLYAAVAIGELDESMDEGARRRSIELSTRFSVASRYTSLLVLESEAMYKAFGLDHQRQAPEWSGTRDSQESETWGGDANQLASEPDAPANKADGAFASEGSRDDKAASQSRSRGLAGSGLGGSGLAGSGQASSGRAAEKKANGSDLGRLLEEDASRERPAATSAARMARKAEAPRDEEPSLDFAVPPPGAPVPAPAKPASPRTIPEAEWQDPSWQPQELPQRRLIPMRRVYDRIGNIDAPPRLLELTSPGRRGQLEARANSDERSRTALKELYVLDFLAGDLERAADEADRWSEKDPLDPDALTARADLAAQRGQRELAIRILGSVVDVRPGDYQAQWRLARLHRWSGDAARGCRHSLAVAQLRLQDPKLVVEALRCARDVGQNGWAEELRGALTPEVRRDVERLEAQPRASDELSGDLRVEASWQGAEHDLDLVILHPNGYRVSWLGAPTRAVISATDVLSVHREGLALRGADAGEYAIEVVRSSPSNGPVRGNLQLRVGKTERSVPFVLEGQRLRVATARIRLSPRLVPIQGWVE